MSHFFCSLRSNAISRFAGFARSRSGILYSVAFISMIGAFSSCGSATKSKEQLSGTNTVKILINDPKPISDTESQRLHNAVKDWYDSALGKRGFNGGILVAKNGNVVFEAYNGNAHVGSKDAMTDTSSLHIASVSKTFTAMAVLKLWQDGKLSLEDELIKFFPGFNYPGVTIRSLLNHRSGLPNYVYFMEQLGWDKKTFISSEDVLATLINRKAEIKNIGLPNTRFTYCNTNYALLALVLEKLTGKKYGAYLEETFFEPLGMKHTFVYDNKDAATVIPSYDHRGGLIPMNFLDVVYGDKNIYSTPKDLLTWDRALTSGILFNEKTLAEAYSPYSNERPGVRNYGLGWRMNIYPTGKKMIYHNGWWHGNNASFIRLLEDSATIIVLGNKFNRNIYHVNKLSNLFGNYLGHADEEEGERATTVEPSPLPKKINRTSTVRKKKATSPTPKKKKITARK